MPNGLWGIFGKRACDMALALGILLLLWPLLLVVAILVGFKLGSPVIFSQSRLGRGAKEFKLYKFRSMTDARGPNGELLPDEVRLTRFGRLLRSTSLDELPQILNILKGEMSFIGPRATLPAYKAKLLEKYPERFEATPGITSLPAIRGRNALDWDQKFSLDVEYVRRFGFMMDLEIFLKTIPVILGREGISMPGQATTTRYDQQENNKN
ncbi:sugar transferase [Malikia spinosa]|uniref:Sugar transferase n=1 Tax=Malikia spinosa TaxID=86180 RepID=A0A7C9IZ52_9BURK|nr:sugar transferase [Malikia spinosa]MYZ53007.1 sugar transferase [Malikia spinosa]